MKITINTNVFRDAVKTVALAAAGKNTMPVLSSMLIDAKLERPVEFSATNLESGLRLSVEGDVSDPGSMCLPAKKLADIAGTLDGEAVTIEKLANDRALITCGNAKFKIAGLDPEEFPPFPDVTDVVVRLPGADLKHLFGQVVRCISTEETRHFLQGLYVEAKGGTLYCTATDGRRLAHTHMGCQVEQEIAVIVPGRAVGQVMRSFGDVDITISKSSEQVAFSADGMMLTTRLIDGDYPDYRSVMEPVEQNNVKMKAEIISLRSVLRRVETCGAGAVKLTLNGNLAVSSSSVELGEASDEMDVEAQGEIEISTKYQFLDDALAGLDGEEATLTFKDPLSPVMVSGDGEYRCVVMPLRV